MRIEPLSRSASASDLDELGELLCDAVASGASVGFLAPLTVESARAFWHNVLERAHPRSVTLVARDDRSIVGSVQLVPAGMQNQRHRAEVAQLLVHRRARRRGIGRTLMAELEKWAALGGFKLLTLGMQQDDAAERLYRESGWTRFGRVPGYALDPEGNPCDTVFFYKELMAEQGFGPRASARGWL